MTCVLVTHEMRFAEEVSDAVYFTEAGVIVEHGPANALFRAPASSRTREFLAHTPSAPETVHAVPPRSPLALDLRYFAI